MKDALLKAGIKIPPKKIFCIACDKGVEARLTDGKEIYPHRPDLYATPFWKCDVCKNYVGCHHRSETPTKPLGCIATPEIFKLRHEIHDIIDPIWRSGIMPRQRVYQLLTEVLGRQYHTADLRSIEECRLILAAAKTLTPTKG